MSRPALKALLLFCLGLFFARPAHAATLAECKDLALHNSALLNAYENLIKSAVYTNRSDKDSLFPQIYGHYQPTYLWYGSGADFAHHGLTQTLGASFSLDLPKILANYPALSSLEIEKSKLVETIAENEVIKDLTQNYYRLYVFLQKEKYYANAKSYIASHIEDIKNLQSKGLTVELDLIRAKVQLRSLFISISNINQEITNALTALNSLMNTTYTEADFHDMDVPDMKALVTDQAIFSESVPESKEIRASYIETVESTIPRHMDSLDQSKLNELAVASAKERYRQHKFNYAPTLQAGYEHNFHIIDPTTETNLAFLSLDFNLFDFGKRLNEGRQLRYDYESKKHMFDEQQRRLKLQIDQLTTDIENIESTYKNADTNMRSAKKALEAARGYYEKGTIKETDLLSIFSEYMNAKDQRYEILYSFFAKKAELDALIRGMEHAQAD